MVCLKITWDANSEHEIINSENYSYSVVNSYTRIGTTNPNNSTGTPVYSIPVLTGTDTYRSKPPQTMGGYSGTVPTGEVWALVRVDSRWGAFGEYPYGAGTTISINLTHISGSRIGTSTVNGSNQNFHYWNRYTVTRELRIIDGGETFNYPIVDEDSIQVIEEDCCPPNTLDCGDCCLPCDSIFNEISSIRALVKGLK